MFNGYQYDKKLTFVKEVDKIKKNYLTEREKRKGILIYILKRLIRDWQKIIKRELKILLLICLKILLFVMNINNLRVINIEMKIQLKI